MNRFWSAVIGVVVAALTAGPGALRGASADSEAVDAIVGRFLSQPPGARPAYRARRYLSARCDRVRKEAALEAITDYDPALGFRYSVVNQHGAESVLERVLRPILEAEARSINSGEADRGALTTTNYEFTPDGLDGDGLFRLTAKPRRKERVLVDGSLYLNPEDAGVVRLEGRMAKNPSFWVRRVNIVRHFARINGVRLPIAVESTAQVRFIGDSTFAMRYEYEHVRGRPAQRRVVASPQRP